MRIKVLNIFLAFIFAILTFGVITTVNYNSDIKKMEKISNMFYNKNSVFFSTKKENVDFKELYKNLPEDSVLYNTLIDAQYRKDIRAIVYKGKYEIPKIESGRFFSEEDFKSGNNKIAVVGKDIKTQKDGTKEYYQFEGEDYEVIGKIGYTMPTKLDYTVMLPLSELTIHPNYEFSISSNTTEESDKFIENKTVFGDAFKFDKNNPSIIHMVNMDKNQDIISITFILIIFFNALLLAYFWLNKKEEEFIVKRMNGYQKGQILKSVIIEYATIAVEGVLMGVVLSVIFSINRFDVNILEVVASSVFILIFCMLYFLPVSSRKITNISKKKLAVNN